MKRLTLQASGNSYFQGFECEHCGSHQVLATESTNPYCACCGNQLGKGTPVSRAEITASTETPTYVKCVACNTVFAVDGTEDTGAEVAAKTYCPECAGDSLVECNASGEAVENPDPDVDEPGEDNSPESSSEDDDQKKTDEQLDDSIAQPETGSDFDENQAELVEASTAADLQWNAIDTDKGEMTAMIASSVKTGNPIAIFRKENAPDSMQPLFAQSLFISAFNEVAKDDGLAEAIKAFGGTFYTPKLFTAQDMEKSALKRMETTAIPRLIDCCQMAVEGGCKGIYPDVYSSLQKSIVNELIASGVDSERATQAVSNTFSIHGSELFGTIMVKAMELFTKPETVRAEAKALIMQASTAIPSATISKEQAEIKAALEKPTFDPGVMNITGSAFNNPSADQLKALRRELF